MTTSRLRQSGFTIVELLIVIIVIGILAAIVIVAYTGVQNRANDAAVQSDLKNIGSKIMEFVVLNDKLPASNAEMTTMNLRTTKNAYGAHYMVGSSAYNLLYCSSPASSPTPSFVLVAASKSGNVYAYRDGAAREGVGPMRTHTTTCDSNGLTTTLTMWQYAAGVWQSWIK